MVRMAIYFSLLRYRCRTHTTCEEAAALAISSLGIPNQGWTITLDDSGLITESCGLDFVMDLVSEIELCPAFPSIRTDLLRVGRPNSRLSSSTEQQDLASIKRPQVPPPDPPATINNQFYQFKQLQKVSESNQRINETIQDMSDRDHRKSDRGKPIQNKALDNEYSGKQSDGVTHKTSHDLLSRSSALNDRYFETEKMRSRSLDDLLTGDNENDQIEIIPDPEPLLNLGLSESGLNDRYH